MVTRITSELDQYLSDLNWTGVIGDVVTEYGSSRAMASFTFITDICGRLHRVESVIRIHDDMSISFTVHYKRPITVVLDKYKDKPLKDRLRIGMENLVYKLGKSNRFNVDVVEEFVLTTIMDSKGSCLLPDKKENETGFILSFSSNGREYAFDVSDGKVTMLTNVPRNPGLIERLEEISLDDDDPDVILSLAESEPMLKTTYEYKGRELSRKELDRYWETFLKVAEMLTSEM